MDSKITTCTALAEGRVGKNTTWNEPAK